MTKEVEIVCPPGQQEDEAVLIALASAAINIPQQRYQRNQNTKTLY
jgi:hypothetical protein